MAYSSTTPNFNLPIIEANDITSWYDINTGNRIVDEQMQLNKTAAEEAKAIGATNTGSLTVMSTRLKTVSEDTAGLAARTTLLEQNATNVNAKVTQISDKMDVLYPSYEEYVQAVTGGLKATYAPSALHIYDNDVTLFQYTTGNSYEWLKARAGAIFNYGSSTLVERSWISFGQSGLPEYLKEILQLSSFMGGANSTFVNVANVDFTLLLKPNTTYDFKFVYPSKPTGDITFTTSFHSNIDPTDITIVTPA